MSDDVNNQLKLGVAEVSPKYLDSVEKYEFEPIRATRCSTGAASARSPRRSITRRS